MKKTDKILLKVTFGLTFLIGLVGFILGLNGMVFEGKHIASFICGILGMIFAAIGWIIIFNRPKNNEKKMVFERIVVPHNVCSICGLERCDHLNALRLRNIELARMPIPPPFQPLDYVDRVNNRQYGRSSITEGMAFLRARQLMEEASFHQMSMASPQPIHVQRSRNNDPAKPVTFSLTMVKNRQTKEEAIEEKAAPRMVFNAISDLEVNE